MSNVSMPNRGFATVLMQLNAELLVGATDTLVVLVFEVKPKSLSAESRILQKVMMVMVKDEGSGDSNPLMSSCISCWDSLSVGWGSDSIFEEQWLTLST